jgi:hypothetical protein
MPGKHRLIGFAIATALTSTTVVAGEWSGSIALEYRAFLHAPILPDQERNDYSLAFQPEYVHSLTDSKDSLRFTPFFRVDRHDENRSHADIRELAWLGVGDDYEWRVGVRKVFWGVTESQHLVDVVNQTDLVENIDGEDKLGQPMINLALIRDWGTLDLFVLPYFRERTFPAKEGRLRTPLPVDTDQAEYESSREQAHVDYALRWSHSWSGIDLGLSYFTGTSRDPRLTVGLDNDGQPVLVPHYDLMRQAGLDVAATLGAWLWKLEAVRRSVNDGTYVASTFGFEYTMSGVLGSGADLGILAEYLHDDRGDDASSPFQDDVFVGARLALNDEQSSEILFGVMQDRDSDSRFVSLEANRRLAEGWKLTLEARAFTDTPTTDVFFYSMRQDDYVQVELARYF